MYQVLLGLAVVVLFERLARSDEENPVLWALLAAGAWFLPAFLLGPVWPFVAVGLLFAVYFARLMGKDPKGGKVR